MRVAIECAGFTASEADQLRRSMATFKFKGDVSKFQHKLIEGMLERGYDRGIRRAHLQAARRLRLLWFSGKPRGVLCADRLCVVLDEMPPSRCVLLRAIECPADGLLCAGATRPRCAAARRRDQAGRHQPFPMGLHAGSERGADWRRAPRLAHGQRVGQCGRRGDRAHARRHAVRIGRGYLAARRRSGVGSRTAGRGRRFRLDRPQPARCALADQRTGRRAAAAFRRRGRSRSAPAAGIGTSRRFAHAHDAGA